MSILILRPLINEKSMSLAKTGLYTFEVAKDATKAQIERYVHGKFGVEVLKVLTVNIPSKKKLQRSRKGYFSQGGFRKAIVRVKKGQKIDLFEAAAAPEEEVEVKTADSVKEKKSLLKGTRVKIEKESTAGSSQLTDKEEVEKKTDTKRPTKKSQKEDRKKGGK